MLADDLPMGVGLEVSAPLSLRRVSGPQTSLHIVDDGEEVSDPSVLLLRESMARKSYAAQLGEEFGRRDGIGE